LKFYFLKYKPKEVLVEKGNLSKLSLAILKGVNPLISIRRPEHYLTTDETLETIAKYYDEKKVPQVVLEMKDNDLIMASLGGTLQYLKELQIDGALFSMSNFVKYDTSETVSTMILDGQVCDSISHPLDSPKLGNSQKQFGWIKKRNFVEFIGSMQNSIWKEIIQKLVVSSFERYFTNYRQIQCNFRYHRSFRGI
jgi:hypothetical protein